MVNHKTSLDGADDDSPLVQWIRLAGEVITPSAQLRPQVLEAVQEQFRRQQRSHLLFSALLFAVISSGLIGMGQAAQRGRPLPFVSGTELQQRAVARAQQSSQSLDWALMEVIRDQRAVVLADWQTGGWWSDAQQASRSGKHGPDAASPARWQR